MIIGVFLRNFKVYKSITYVPISNGDKFCGLIGRNGIGKSSILEALDCYFNNKQFNVNIDNSNAEDEESYIVPLFAIKKTEVPEGSLSDLSESYSSSFWSVVEGEITQPIINNNYVEQFKLVKEHITKVNFINKETHYILPIGVSRYGNPSIGIFRDSVFLDSIVEVIDGENKQLNVKRAIAKLIDLNDFIKTQFQYVYIPKDIEADRLVQFERLEIQTLLGTKLEDIVSNFLSRRTINDISQGLKRFIEELSSILPNYKYRTPTYNQPNLKVDKIYSLIIQEFFSVRELHKEGGDGKDISLKHLSSGEKQQAILSLIHSIISEYRDDSTATLIIAVDEPESSLHVSACYDQFEKMYNISNECCQTIFSSHWYGFIPAMTDGSITNIINENNRHTGYIFNIYKYREELKHSERSYSAEQHSRLPVDIMLKSSNDFVQSILMSVICDDEYNWLICEGSSDKIYLDAYFHEEIISRKLRIIPVCTASEVKNIYKRLSILFDELKGQVKGKVFLLIDTDASPLEFDTADNLEKNLRCRRIVNDTGAKLTKLVKVQSSPKAPKTDIEDVLNGKVFNTALLHFKSEGEELLAFIDDSEKDEIPSYFAMDLKPSEGQSLDDFFNANTGLNKVLFAKKYVELLAGSINPSWIDEIAEYFNK